MPEKECRHRFFPRFFQRSVQGEQVHGGGGGAGQCPIVIADVQKQSADVLGSERQGRICQQLLDLAGVQTENKGKGQGRVFAPDQLKTRRTQLFPVDKPTVGADRGILFLIRLRVKIRMKYLMN